MTRQTVHTVDAHPDDGFGVGGTIAKHAHVGTDVQMLIAVHRATQQCIDPAAIDRTQTEDEHCGRHLGVESGHHAGLPKMELDTVPHGERDAVLDATITVEADTVNPHGPTNVGLDQTPVVESTLVTTRSQSRLEFVPADAVPSSMAWTGGVTGWFSPTVLIDRTELLETELHTSDAWEFERRSLSQLRSPKAARSRARFQRVSTGFDAAEAFRLIWTNQPMV